MAKTLSLIIHTQIDLQRGHVIEMLNALLVEHFVTTDEQDDGKGVATTAHAWSSVASEGGLHKLLSGLSNKSLQEALGIMFPTPMPAQTFSDLVHALSYDDMKQMVLSGPQYASVLKWASFRMGDAVMHLYDEMVKETEAERRGRALLTVHHAVDTLKTIGWGLQPPTEWHGDRRARARTDRRKAQE